VWWVVEKHHCSVLYLCVSDVCRPVCICVCVGLCVCVGRWQRFIVTCRVSEWQRLLSVRSSVTRLCWQLPSARCWLWLSTASCPFHVGAWERRLNSKSYDNCHTSSFIRHLSLSNITHLKTYKNADNNKRWWWVLTLAAYISTHSPSWLAWFKDYYYCYYYYCY